MFHDPFIQIVTAQPCIPMSGKHLKNAFVQLQDAEVESASAEIVNRYLGMIFELVQTVGQCRGGRLIDDAFHHEPGQLAGLAGGVALGIVEIGGDCDDGVCDRFAEKDFRVVFQLGQDQR